MCFGVLWVFRGLSGSFGVLRVLCVVLCGSFGDPLGVLLKVLLGSFGALVGFFGALVGSFVPLVVSFAALEGHLRLL